MAISEEVNKLQNNDLTAQGLMSNKRHNTILAFVVLYFCIPQLFKYII